MSAKPGNQKDEFEARRSNKLLVARRRACDAIGALDMEEARRLMHNNISKQRQFAATMVENGF